MDKETKALVQEVAIEAARCAIKDVLTKLGIDHTDPFKVQRDMAALRELRELLEDHEFQQDMAAIRNWRKSINAIQTKGIVKASMFLMVGGMAFLFVLVKGLWPFGG